MPEFSWIEVHKEFVDTVKWISTFKNINIDETVLPEMLLFTEHMGVNYPKYCNKEIPEFEYGEESVHAMIDATTFNLIRQSFEGRNFPQFRINLKNAVMGPLKSSDENNLGNSTQARNMLYELESAAFQISIGYDVTNELDDINYYIGDKKINIQNKRLLTDKNLEYHFNQAVLQLKRDNKIDTDPNSYGFVAFSLEKLYGMDKGVLPVQNMDELEADMEKIRLEMNDKTESFFTKAFEENGEDFRLLGRMYYYKRVVQFADRNTTSFFRRFLYEITPNTPYVDIVDYIYNKNPAI